MMRSEFNVIIEQDSEGTYVASVPALRGCHTQGNSLDQVMERIREAIALCIEVQGENVETLDFVGIQKISVNP
jgi:predicted RNase H-like HicB family nuclease